MPRYESYEEACEAVQSMEDEDARAQARNDPVQEESESEHEDDGESVPNGGCSILPRFSLLL